MECANVGRAIAKEARRDRVRAAVARGESESVGDRQMRADDRVRAHRPERRVGQMHRAALAAAQSPPPAQKLAESAAQGHAHCEHRAVAAVGAGHRVAVFEGGAGAGCDRFLPLIEVRRRAHESLREELLHLDLKFADRAHGEEQRGFIARLDSREGGARRVAGGDVHHQLPREASGGATP